MKIIDVLKPEHVICGLKASSMKRVLKELSQKASDLFGLDHRDIFNLLLERERLGSTAIGEGVAIPHAKISHLDTMITLAATLEEPVDFDAIDGQAVDIVFLILAPEHPGTDHLKALAKLANKLRDSSLKDQLRNASDQMQFCDCLIQSIETKSFQHTRP